MDSQKLIIFVTITFHIFASFSIGYGVLKIDNQLFESEVNGVIEGTKWAVLVAGSSSYWNYRHQADICHAYHIFKNGGFKDENIIVFMYDDIAYNKENPRPGVIINNPQGKNVYPGVLKDYTGEAVNSENLFAVILGNKTATKGGSGKVLTTSPNDHIFIYYADHGGPGVLGMPNETDYIYAIDLLYVLMKKYTTKSYKKMVIYVEACDSGSIFDGILSEGMNIYVTTAANTNESSYATYCGDQKSPKGYEGTCLGDVFSVSWMEDSDKCNPMKETLEQQYVAVRNRTASAKYQSSHVMQYGELSLKEDVLAAYLVVNSSRGIRDTQTKPARPLMAVDQRDADLVYFKNKVGRAPEGSNERRDAQKELDEKINHRKFVDGSVAVIGEALFGKEKGPLILNFVRPAGQPLVDDWDCLKAMVRIYEAQLGSLKSYGKKYMRAFANICNAGVGKDDMAQAIAFANIYHHHA